jgi:hypothetical protein
MRTKSQEQQNQEFFERFTRTLKDFPIITKISIKTKTRNFIVEMPTSEVFAEGDWLSRQLPGVKVSLVEKYLKKMGHLSGVYGTYTIEFLN